MNPRLDLFSGMQPKTFLPPLFHVNAMFCPEFWIISACVPVIYFPVLTVPLFLSRRAPPSTAVCALQCVLHLRVSNHRHPPCVFNCRTASVCASLSLSESIQVFFSQSVWVFFFFLIRLPVLFQPSWLAVICWWLRFNAAWLWTVPRILLTTSLTAYPCNPAHLSIKDFKHCFSWERLRSVPDRFIIFTDKSAAWR